MSSNQSVKDEDILNGFASIHQAMTQGFDAVARRFNDVDRRFNDLEAGLHDVRNDVARLEQRMLRRFDDVDERFDKLEGRVTALEVRTA
jgi:hypothetical protein